MKKSNESYSYNLLNHINKMYTHDLFNLQQEWEAWLAPVYKQIRKWRASAAIAGRLCEGHVALRNTQRFKTKASSAPVPGLLTVQ